MLAIAWPASLAAILTPLLGLIDVAVLSRAEGADALAGASLAGSVIALVYWTLGFLRMSLSGLAAQALGRADDIRLRAHLLQGVALGFAMGLLVLALSAPIIGISRLALADSSQASPAAAQAMATYLGIRLWGAPAALTTTALVGWLTGQGRTGLMMLITVATALINAGLSVLFVLAMERGIAGLALATVLAELSGLAIALLGCAYVLGRRGSIFGGFRLDAAREGIGAVLSLNRDIFVRTLLLDVVFLSFARFGAGFGDLTLAANHVLLNLVLTTSLLLDGTAIAAETFVGQALGSGRDRAGLFEAAWRRTAEVTAALAAALCLALLLFGPALLRLIIGEGPETDAIFSEAMRFVPWAILAPLLVAPAYHLDGVYIGATRGAALRNTMGVSALVYLAAAALLIPALGNHGLWLAFLIFMVARGATLAAAWRGFSPLIAAARRA